MEREEFLRLAEFIYSSQFSPEQGAMLKQLVQNLDIVYFEKADNGYHISEIASSYLDNLIKQGASLTECMRECNVSKTTVLRHRKKLQKLEEEEQKQRELEEKRKQEILARDDGDLEKSLLQAMERIKNSELPF